MSTPASLLLALGLLNLVIGRVMVFVAAAEGCLE
jgi:hypothetical protein